MAGYEHGVESPEIGRVLGGRYRLVAPIARGGMAEVWEGHDEILSRPVAVKVLQSHLATDGLFLERFRREAITAARLAHPAIVATFDTGFDEGTAFIVMELVRGRNLREWLDRYGRLQPWQAVGVTRQVADALSYAHQAGLVHRDVKPANILLVDDDGVGLAAWRVKVTDFGIAKAGIGGGADLTRTGMVLGTPKYLSPEQIRGNDPDARADLYSLGVVLYEMLVGAPPYVGDTDMATALAHLGDKVPKPSASVRGVPGGLDRIVVDLLAKSPDRRVPNGLELRRRLDALGPLSVPAPAHPRVDRPAPPAPPPAAPATAPAAAPAGAVGSADPAGGAQAVPAAPPRPAAAVASVLLPDGGIAADATGLHTASPTVALATQVGPRSFPAQTDANTDELDGFTPTHARPRHQVERTVGWVVLALVVAGALVSAVLLSSGSSPRHHSLGGGSTSLSVPTGPAVTISAVQVYLPVTGHQLDNPDQTGLAFDGNPATFWSTDQYFSPTFGNMYPGIGLEIQLSGSRALQQLSVTSATTGWSASTYVSATEVPTGQPVSAWGVPTASQSGIAGSTTFSLGGRSGEYVLLWITNLGAGDRAEVAELSLH